MAFSLDDRSGGNCVGDKGLLRDIDTGTEYEYRKINDPVYTVELVTTFVGLKLKAVDVFALRNEMEILVISSKFAPPDILAEEVNSETDKVRAEVVRVFS